MDKIHVGSPEAPLFLKTAIDVVDEFIEGTGRCPTAWSELDITYANGPYRIDDDDVRPTPSVGTRWRPRNSNYDYVLEVSGSSCRIVAVNSSGVAEFLVEPGMAEPRALP